MSCNVFIVHNTEYNKTYEYLVDISLFLIYSRFLFLDCIDWYPFTLYGFHDLLFTLYSFIWYIDMLIYCEAITFHSLFSDVHLDNNSSNNKSTSNAIQTTTVKKWLRFTDSIYPLLQTVIKYIFLVILYEYIHNILIAT